MENEIWREQELCGESNLIGAVTFSLGHSHPIVSAGEKPK